MHIRTASLLDHWPSPIGFLLRYSVGIQNLLSLLPPRCILVIVVPRYRGKCVPNVDAAKVTGFFQAQADRLGSGQIFFTGHNFAGNFVVAMKDISYGSRQHRRACVGRDKMRVLRYYSAILLNLLHNPIQGPLEYGMPRCRCKRPIREAIVRLHGNNCRALLFRLRHTNPFIDRPDTFGINVAINSTVVIHNRQTECIGFHDAQR
mmetsp:Transcript_13718/g.22835  ORF Transcript_13718/g.22835 Transcript_13718/m.22835 type:complete len:205 (+) Transcript_13718:115-729(+)